MDLAVVLTEADVERLARVTPALPCHVEVHADVLREKS